ncbi:MAG: Ldh family oxidoreductase [Betaproteobacteria bacterium]|nr:MAG: Ldh family oxidoreductase [Betaproteobacteria bacterium]
MSSQPSTPAGCLDVDAPDTVRMSVAEATALGEGALRRLGYPAEEARIIVDQLVDNALCGYKFAGLPRILAIAGDRKTREARTPVRIVHETPVSAMLDGGNNVGYIAAYRAAEVAIEKVRAMGIASVGAYNSYYSGRNAYYVERIVREGYFAFHVASAQPHILPPGAAAPALGTNPICFGFPSTDGAVIVDMGTAALMWGDVMLHAHLGQPLPEGVGFDSQGRPTTNASEALRGGVGAFGGYKGYALAFAVQAMGLLAGAALSRNRPLDYGFYFVAVDPKIMLPGGDFAQQMAELVRAVKATPRLPSVDEIRIPSERAFRERSRRRVEGIVLERKVVESLRAL